MASANASFISNVTCNHSERKWSKEETEVLISWWEEYMSELRRLGRNTRTYIKISQRIQESFPSQVPRTQKEVQEQIKNLKKQYQHNKTKYGKTGSAPSPWVFFARIHKFLGMLPVNDEGLMRQSAISIETVENDLVPGMEVTNVCELDPEYMTSTQIELDESLSVLSPMSLTVDDENKENETETDEFLSSFSTPARKRRKSTASEAVVSIEREKLKFHKQVLDFQIEKLNEKKRQKLEKEQLQKEFLEIEKKRDERDERMAMKRDEREERRLKIVETNVENFTELIKYLTKK